MTKANKRGIKIAVETPDPLKGATINVCARLFSAVAMFKAVHDIRFYLAGVYVEPGPAGGAIMCATDGHQLALAFDPEGVAPEGGQIIPVHNGMLTAARNRSASRVAVVGGRLTAFNDMFAETFIQPGKPLIEGGKFPEWHLVVPSGEGLQASIRGSWSSNLIHRLTMAGKFLANGRHSSALTHWQKEAKPGELPGQVLGILSRFDSEPNFVVVTMPMRVFEVSPIPEFLPPAIDARRKARKAAAEAKAAAQHEGAPA